MFVVTGLTLLQVTPAGAAEAPAGARKPNRDAYIESQQGQFACGGYAKRHIGAWITFRAWRATRLLISREEGYNYRELIWGTAFGWLDYARRNADSGFIFIHELISFY